jgi:hypothetical protein
MRYILLIYGNEQAKAATSSEAMKKSMEEAQAVMVEMNRAGVFVGADPLQPTGTATTIRNHAGRVMVTDGPFAETKEQLGGYIIVDCRDLDEALEWAAKFPGACGGVGCIEVRPILEVPGFGKKHEMDAAEVHG